MEDFKAKIPWQIKIASKIILSRLPIDYAVWQKFRLFRHGKMDDPRYAIGVIQRIMNFAELNEGLDGLSILELGPGDGLSSAIIAYALGAREVTLVDSGPHASNDMAIYRDLVTELQSPKINLCHAMESIDNDSMLASINSRYLTDGLRSLKKIQTDSVDFIFSNAVLEHIRLKEFRETMRETRRIISPSGRIFHSVDLQDHLSRSLNNLRFSDKIWESNFMAHSGFYTNRIRYKEMIGIFQEEGFSTEIKTVHRFNKAPTSVEGMARRFRNMKTEDFLVSGFGVLLKPAPESA